MLDFRTAVPRSTRLLAAALLASACGPRDRPARADAGTVQRDSAAGTLAPASTPGAAAAKPACAPNNGDITLPAGFCATIFTDDAKNGRGIAVAANGDVYVNRQGQRSNAVMAFRDRNGDGVADTSVAFGGAGNTGIAVVPGWVYVDESSRIARYPLAAGALAPGGEARVVVSGIPTGGHPARNFLLDGRGSLFLNVGSQTNSCQAKDRAAKEPGIDPCAELQTRAGIWRFRADADNQPFSAAARYATGIRNGMGLAMNPADGALYVAFHGRDQLTDWGFTDAQNAELPAEEMVKLQEGGDYGWPYCYYDGQQKKLVLAPEYGGDGKQTSRCAQKLDPVVAFPGHWAPMSALFYSGRTFPAKYRSGAFVAFHGSWNRSPLPQAGFRVAFAPMANGRFTGAYETFADGFMGAAAGSTARRTGAAHRPVGLAQAPDGSIYITDDANGRIWKVVYTGQ